MIEPIMYFGIGFLVAALALLILAGGIVPEPLLDLSRDAALSVPGALR